MVQDSIPEHSDVHRCKRFSFAEYMVIMVLGTDMGTCTCTGTGTGTGYRHHHGADWPDVRGVSSDGFLSSADRRPDDLRRGFASERPLSLRYGMVSWKKKLNVKCNGSVCADEHGC